MRESGKEEVFLTEFTASPAPPGHNVPTWMPCKSSSAATFSTASKFATRKSTHLSKLLLCFAASCDTRRATITFVSAQTCC